jgi:hypothetical protein
MADSKPPAYIPLMGVVTQVNPSAPPPAAVHCHNFRVMPSTDGSLWLRLFGGRKWRASFASGLWKQFHEYRDPLYAGYLNQIRLKITGNLMEWWSLYLGSWDGAKILTIPTTYGGSYCLTRPAPVCNTNEGIVMYNGMGLREPIIGSGSYPALSIWLADVNQLMYVGLDCYVPFLGPHPYVTSTAGTMTILNEITYYVGIHNDRSYHFSNVIKAGVVTAGTNVGVRFDQLNNILMKNHGPYEQGRQKYVFYATVDLQNAEVGYLMTDPADPTRPITADITATTITIPNYVLDVFKEAPVDNFPPRPMRWIAPVEGRIYGALMPGAGLSPTQPDFSYMSPTHYLSGIVWSAAASDVSETFFLGAPEHAWPLDNFRATPNAEQPIWGARSPEGKSLHVVTETTNFIVFEDIDERHSFTEIPGRYGIRNTYTYCERTPHGSIWETQNGEIVALGEGGNIDILSRPYQDKLRGKVSRFATHTFDPPNMIDRYELYFTDNTLWVHDFITGQGYSADGDFTSGKTLMDQAMKRYHMLGNRDLFTQAGQYDDSLGRELVKDDTVGGDFIAVSQRRTGEYESHWIDFGEPGSIGNIAETHVHGDVRNANLTISAWRDHQEPLPNTGIPNVLTSAIFSAANYMVAVGKALLGTVCTLKLRIRLVADANETYYPTMYQYARMSLAKTMVGIVGKIGFVLTKGRIRLQ